jgi:hypothetical protein
MATMGMGNRWLTVSMPSVVCVPSYDPLPCRVHLDMSQRVAVVCHQWVSEVIQAA